MGQENQILDGDSIFIGSETMSPPAGRANGLGDMTQTEDFLSNGPAWSGETGSTATEKAPFFNPESDGDSRTVIVEPAAGGVKMCVGWLLMVKGSCIGKSFPIHSGRNTIGRDRKDVVCIEGDDTVSHSQAAIIYDPEFNDYSIVPFGTGSSLTRLVRHGDRVRVDMSTPVKHGDFIELSSKTVLRFVPACDEMFRWEPANNN